MDAANDSLDFFGQKFVNGLLLSMQQLDLVLRFSNGD